MPTSIDRNLQIRNKVIETSNANENCNFKTVLDMNGIINACTGFSFVACTFMREFLQTEQLVDQQILIDRLRSDLMTFRGTTTGATVESGASGNSGKRPQSVPLIRHSCGHRPPRKVDSCTVCLFVCCPSCT